MHVKGIKGSVSNPDRKKIVEDACEKIMQGHTLSKIAKDHNITSRTLHTWLSSLGDQYSDLRSSYIDGLIADSLCELDAATDQFQLARARERFKAHSWVASTRDKRYSPKQDVNVTSTSISITHALEQARARVIEGSAVLVDELANEQGDEQGDPALEEQVNPTRTAQDGA